MNGNGRRGWQKLTGGFTALFYGLAATSH